MTRFISGIIFLLFCSALAAEQVPDAYKASYSVQLNGFKVGELERSLEHLDNNQYKLTTRAYTTGMVSWFKPDVAVEVSLWHFVDDEPRPISYSYHYTGRNKDRLEQQEFDWGNAVIHYQRGDDIRVLDLEKGVLDKQVFEIALQQSLRRGLSSGKFQVATRGRITDYEFDVLGSEKVVTRPLGPVSTVKVQRGNTIMWLSEQHDYLVVKLEHHDDGNIATSYLIDFH